MKRIVTSVLGVLGFALLTAAVGVNLFLVPQLRVVPLDQAAVNAVAETLAGRWMDSAP